MYVIIAQIKKALLWKKKVKSAQGKLSNGWTEISGTFEVRVGGSTC